MMPLNLNQIVPWGRSYGEYTKMFNLTSGDMEKKIFACADGFSSFNAEGTAKGGNIISCDPIYKYNLNRLSELSENSFQLILSEISRNKQDYNWDIFKNIDELYLHRKKVLKTFLQDYNAQINCRYIAAELPLLPIKEKSFGLVLVSHFMFLYSEQISFEDHLNFLLECLRVSDEIRVYPIITMGLYVYPLLTDLVNYFLKLGFYGYTEKVEYNFLSGANEMLVLKHKYEL